MNAKIRSWVPELVAALFVLLFLYTALNKLQYFDGFVASIDRNPLFKGTCKVEDRSRMNVCFVMENPELEKPFLNFAQERGMIGIKGHRSVGGFRASIYNALPITAVHSLIETMQEFAEKNG